MYCAETKIYELFSPYYKYLKQMFWTGTFLQKNVMMKKLTTKASCHGGWNVNKNYVTGISIMVYVFLSPAHVHICIIYDIPSSIE